MPSSRPPKPGDDSSAPWPETRIVQAVLSPDERASAISELLGRWPTSRAAK